MEIKDWFSIWRRERQALDRGQGNLSNVLQAEVQIAALPAGTSEDWAMKISALSSHLKPQTDMARAVMAEAQRASVQ